MNSHQRAFALACLLAISALFLVACGDGDDGGSSGGEEDTIVDVVTKAAETEEPETCTALLTLQFNEQTQKVSGKEAIAACEAETEDDESGTDSVDVSNVQVDGTGAEADVAFSGGDFDGQTMTIALVEEDGQWKLDEIVGFAEFDREALLGGLSESLDESVEGDEERAEADCIVEGIEGLDDESLEGIFLEDNFDTLGEIAEGC